MAVLFSLARHLADDGKRSPALGVAFRAGGFSEGRESEGGEWAKDDGKRFDALGVAFRAGGS